MEGKLKSISTSVRKLAFVIAFVFGIYQNGKSQGMVLTQCAIDLIEGVDSLVSGLSTLTTCVSYLPSGPSTPPPFKNVGTQRTILDGGCSLMGCNCGTNTRFVFSSVADYTDHIDLSWPVQTGTTTYSIVSLDFNQRAICTPSIGYFANTSSITTNSDAFPHCSSPLLLNVSDKLRFKEILGSTYIDMNVHDIKGVKNPRLMNSLDIGFWNLSSTLAAFTCTSCATGILVDVTLNNDKIVTAMLFHDYSKDFPSFSAASTMTWKQNITCPSISSYATSTLNTSPGCTQLQATVNISGITSGSCTNVLWDHGDGSILDVSSCVTVSPITNTYTYVSPGTYTSSVYISGPGSCFSGSTAVVSTTCIPPCVDCIPSFAPVPGGTYVVSGWVKEATATQSVTSYTKPKITIAFTPTTLTAATFTTSSGIIDGWQRIEGKFVIPNSATDIDIKLECTTGDCYFDDIRVFPTDGSMKSYVYDPVNMRLVAELDERNYATLYEYDEEGKLVRVKKETEKGKMTIQENRNKTKKN